MACNNETLCLDKKENTKVIFGSNVMKLDEFEDMLNKEPELARKMKKIEEKLKDY